MTTIADLRALMIFENRLRDGDPLAVLASAGDRP